MKTKYYWQYREGTKVQAPISYCNHFVISHRPNCYTLSYRPPERHLHCGVFPNLLEAKQAAEDFNP